MERKARESLDTIKVAAQGFVSWPWGWIRVIMATLLIAALFVSPNWRTAAAIGLIIGAFAVERAVASSEVGPYAALVASVVVTRRLFLEDSEGRTRAWLGLENEYGDEHGPRLVFYDEMGQARLALRLIEEQKEHALEASDREAEVVRRGEGSEEADLAKPAEPALVMFNRDGRISLSLWSSGDQPALETIGAGGHAGVQPGNIWALPRDGKLWSAPPEQAKDIFED